MAAIRQTVFSFNEGRDTTLTPQVRGGKGAGLAELVGLGLPVPPGFTIPAGVSRAYMETGCLPNRLFGQIERGIAALEQVTGRQFGDPTNPLLVSVRSGAAVSMPGMMDTILNVGLNPTDARGLADWGSKRFSRNTRQRFVDQWAKSLDLPTIDPQDIPTNPYTQLYHAIHAVLESWNSERARVYRKKHDIPHWWGTAITVQAMVFGNVDQESCTGVVFSANVATGQEGLYGEFLPRAQGEDVVAGVRTPLPITDLETWNPTVYAQLEQYVKLLADHYGAVVDVEFTVERGKLYILQARKAKLSPLANVTQAVHAVWDGKLTKQQALARVSAAEIERLRRPAFSANSQSQMRRRSLGSGLPASPGAAVGLVAFSSEEACRIAQTGLDVILVRHDTSPEDLPGMMAAKAIVTKTGGATCHAAVVARELGLPAVVGVTNLPLDLLRECETLSVDGTHGIVAQGNWPVVTPELPKEVNIFLRWIAPRNHYDPRIGFEWTDRYNSANQCLNDFYITDRMAHESQGTPLAERAHDLRQKTHRDIAECFAAYLALAITGEARHYWSNADPRGKSQEAAQQLHDWMQLANFVDRPRRAAQIAAQAYLEAATLEHQIEFVTQVTAVFELADWLGSSYGGTRWANIASTLLQFLQGKLPPSVFVDHVFDLRHNGGTLFDKHPMFTHRTMEGILLEQLESKKSKLSSRALQHALESHEDFSPAVEALWMEGSAQSLW